MMLSSKAVLARRVVASTTTSCRIVIGTSSSSGLRPKSSMPLEQLAVKSASSSTKTASSSASSSTASASSNEVKTPIVQSLAAALLGVASVSIAAAVVEYQTAPSVPTFDPNGQRFDQSNFGGRFAKMLLACDPRLLLYSEDEVRRCTDMVKNYALYKSKSAGAASGVTANQHDMDRALWEARRISESALHPDTGDIIPRPFRMSGYVPFNGPICVAMVASTSTMPLLFWSWVNQSQNALVNYYNRNASSPMTNTNLAVSYGAAVGSALLVAFGLATAIQRRFEPAKARSLLRWVAFPSAVVASSLNCYIVRRPEMFTGVPLVNEVGEDVLQGETSCEAAKLGVHSTTASRALLQAPVYFLPPVLLTLGPLKRYLMRVPTAAVPITTYLLLLSFGVGLPATVAIFPQMSQVAVHDVEPKYWHLRDPRTNKPYEVYYYNKGL